MTDDAMYAPGGRLPDHLRAAVLLAGGTIDQLEVWFSPERRDGIGTLDVARLRDSYAHLNRGCLVGGTAGGTQWAVYSLRGEAIALRETKEEAIDLLIRLHTEDAQ